MDDRKTVRARHNWKWWRTCRDCFVDRRNRRTRMKRKLEETFHTDTHVLLVWIIGVLWIVFLYIILFVRPIRQTCVVRYLRVINTEQIRVCTEMQQNTNDDPPTTSCQTWRLRVHLSAMNMTSSGIVAPARNLVGITRIGPLRVSGRTCVTYCTENSKIRFIQSGPVRTMRTYGRLL